jgi:hypothetical protein
VSERNERYVYSCTARILRFTKSNGEISSIQDEI